MHDGHDAEEDLNRFLAAHRVVSIERQFVADGSRSTWAVCVSWVEGVAREVSQGSDTRKARVNYREVLPAEDFAVYVKLRELRKTLADKEAVPPYAVFTNEQCAEVVRRKVRSIEELARIDGIGPARVEKHGAAFLNVLRAPSGPPSAATPSTTPAKEA